MFCFQDSPSLEVGRDFCPKRDLNEAQRPQVYEKTGVDLGRGIRI